ncbi:S4 domain-containing protein [Georgenia sp. 10Sc9-8]|uniref:S4 domain-containing protein n=1 Tax=Georgenia halotolerans TaxID=3028317 RepID=A0ABT5TVV0_9MICO|nr:S4 domain-containing protein [Georgenia halotolerans]
MTQTETGSVRVDSWLWAVRLFKSRSQATAACRAGHVRVNDDRVKPAATVRRGDRVVVRGGDRERVVVVEQLLVKRVSAPAAALAMVDHSPPPPPPVERGAVPYRPRGSGRPTKRDRREIERLRGY